ncbi:hypothetical protein EON79_02695 [bacterium]|nr:MAG: hypothetical protein EON79_02695 [bacterium]
MEESYLVELEDRTRYGPVALPALRELALQGRLKPETMLVGSSSGERIRADALGDLVFVPSPNLPPGSSYFRPRAKPNGTSLSGLMAGLILLSCTGIVAAILVPIFASARQASRIVRVRTKLKTLGNGILLYANDQNDRFPPTMESVAAMRPYIGPYVEIPEFLNAVDADGVETLTDARLSGRSLLALDSLTDTILLYNRPATGAGQTMMVNADGSVRNIPKPELARRLREDPFGGKSPAEDGATAEDETTP